MTTSMAILSFLTLFNFVVVTVVYSNFEKVNAIRDSIIVGLSSNGAAMTLDHRWLRFRNDWLPAKFGFAAILLFFSALIGFAPILLEIPDEYRLLFTLSAVLPGGGFLAFSILGLADMFHIIKVLRGARFGT